jgi:Domain of unknown function (DUF397)
MRLFRRGERAGSFGETPMGNWRKSTRSWANGNCVEVGQLAGGVVGVRDSKSAQGPVLKFEVGKWNDCLADVRTGQVPL